MTILIAGSSGLLDGALITSCRNDQFTVQQHGYGAPWCIYDRHQAGRLVSRYPDAPGMNALVALRQYLVERERDRIGTCDSCGQMMYRDDDAVMQPVTIAEERGGDTIQMHRRCVEGED